MTTILWRIEQCGNEGHLACISVVLRGRGRAALGFKEVMRCLSLHGYDAVSRQCRKVCTCSHTRCGGDNAGKNTESISEVAGKGLAGCRPRSERDDPQGAYLEEQ